MESLDCVFFSCHSSLSFITSGWLTRLCPASLLSWCIKSLLESIRTLLIFSPLLLHLVLFFLVGWSERWEVSGRTTVFWGSASRICSKHRPFFYSSHPAFSPSVSLEFRWCIHTVVPTRPLVGKNPVLFYKSDQISIWSTTSHKWFFSSVCILLT